MTTEPRPSAPFLVVGEALVDIVMPVQGPTVDAPGGSPLNVAVGLARLGEPTVLVTRIGDDPHGRLVADHVAASDVRLAAGSLAAGHRTSTATAHLAQDGSASYEFDLVWDLPPTPLPEPVAAVHTGSLGALLDPGRDAVLGLVDEAVARGVFVSFDPNPRPAFVVDPTEVWQRVVATARRARLVKLSDEDVRLLRPDVSEVEAIGELLALDDTELVVVTRGADGASGYTAGVAVDVPAPGGTVADTVGAGDSFMAALIAILSDEGVTAAAPGRLGAMTEDEVRVLLGGSALAAAVTCSRRGANPPTRAELPPTWPVG